MFLSMILALVVTLSVVMCIQSGTMPTRDVPGKDIVPRFNESVRIQYHETEGMVIAGYIIKGNKLDEIMKFYQDYFESKGYEALSAGGGMSASLQIPFLGEAGIKEQVMLHFSKGDEKYTLCIYVVDVGGQYTYYTITKSESE